MGQDIMATVAALVGRFGVLGERHKRHGAEVEAAYAGGKAEGAIAAKGDDAS